MYGAAAAGLAPWIVILYLTQVARGVTRHGSGLAGGLLLAMIMTVLLAAWVSWRGSPRTAMAAAAAAAVAFITGWFRVLTFVRTVSWEGRIMVTFVVVVAVIVTVCAVLIRGEFAAAAAPARRRWLPAVLAAAALPLIGGLAFELIAAAPVEPAHHLVIAWTGLDCYELAAMTATAVTVHRRLPVAVIPATVTGSLLMCDAWINVAATSGAGRAEGIALAFVEVPFAALSFWVAARIAPQFRGAPLRAEQA